MSAADTPRISNPCAAYWLRNSISQGVSILHGPHHVAQKLISSALPLYPARETFLPFKSSKANAGAILPSSGETNFGIPPAPSGTNTPFAAPASARSAACLRYSQLAQPAHAKTARMTNTMPRTTVLRFTGMRPLLSDSTAAVKAGKAPQRLGFLGVYLGFCCGNPQRNE